MTDRYTGRKQNTGRNTVTGNSRGASVRRQDTRSSSDRRDDSRNRASEKEKSLDDYSPAMQKQIKKEMQRIKFRRNLLIFGFSSVAVVCIGYFVWYYASADKNGTGQDGE